MSDATFNRRQFAQTLGLALGGALVLPELVAPAAEARQHAPRSADGAIQIDSNENPYGPSDKTRDAITNSQPIACRYPDVTENRMAEAIAKHNEVPVAQ